jgi:hypothetical protein
MLVREEVVEVVGVNEGRRIGLKGRDGCGGSSLKERQKRSRQKEPPKTVSVVTRSLIT